MEIDTGDTVLHRPTGEEWLVALVDDDRLMWCGWPEGSAKLSDCELVSKATPAERNKLLRELADVRIIDRLQQLAMHRLAAEMMDASNER